MCGEYLCKCLFEVRVSNLLLMGASILQPQWNNSIRMLTVFLVVCFDLQSELGSEDKMPEKLEQEVKFIYPKMTFDAKTTWPNSVLPNITSINSRKSKTKIM